MVWKERRRIPKKWEIVVDIDSVVFMCIREYAQLVHAYVDPNKWSMRRLLKDLVDMCLEEIYMLHKFCGERATYVSSVGYPKLKKELYRERKKKKEALSKEEGVIQWLKKYIPFLRDDIRDKVVDKMVANVNVIQVEEADKYCGRNYKYIITEDVDVFLFGDSATTIIKPPQFFYNQDPKKITYLSCEEYYQHWRLTSHVDFLQVCIMMGTDYNHGVYGIGVARSLANINTYSSLENFLHETTDRWEKGEKERFVKEYRRAMSFILF
jgi:5'-3' exonuclease